MGRVSGELLVSELGTVEYREALALQERLRDARARDQVGDLLLLLEHPPVYTRGRRSGPGELPMGESWYLSQGIDIVDTDRGGKITYHGPGQLVGYPIMLIEDVIAYVRTMERALIAALAEGPHVAHVEDARAAGVRSRASAHAAEATGGPRRRSSDTSRCRSP